MLRCGPSLCTSSCCVPFPATSASASVRSSASSRSAWNTSPPRSKRAATASRSPICASAARSSISCAPAGPASSASPRCTRSRPTTCWRWRAAFARSSPDVPIVVGGHTAAAYPDPFLVARRRRRRRSTMASGRCRASRTRSNAARPLTNGAGPRAAATATASICAPPARRGTFVLDDVPLPARHHVAPWRRQYACLAHRPAWLIETARGCPFRCSFCSIWQLHARVGARAVDRLGLPRLRVGRRPRLRRRRSVLVSPVAQPGAGAGAAAPRHPQAVDPGAEPRRSRGAAPGAARGVAADRAGLRHLLRPRGGDQRRADGPDEGRDRRSDRAGHRRRAAARLRRHRQLRDRSGLGAKRTSSGCGRSSSATSCSRPASPSSRRCRAPPTSRRCAPRLRARRWSHFDMHHLLWEPALGAGALLRAVLRDLAAVGAEPARPQEPVAVAARGRSAQRAVPARARCGARSA